MKTIQDQIIKEEKRMAKMDSVAIEQVLIENEIYFKISNSDSLRPFFMSIVSDSNHWMFISSNGALTAGRKNSEYALFPYYTDDKITESAEITGSKSLFQIDRNGSKHLWEPFSGRNEGLYNISRNLYKNRCGNKLLFEEINHDFKLSFRYEWCNSNLYGFVRKSTLANHSNELRSINCLDGIQNLLPFGVPSDLQNSASNLVDAYKRNELHEDSGLGIYALSAIIVDRAEPSEALKANVAWSLGLDKPKYLLSSLQLKAFRNFESIKQEVDIKGEKGAFFVEKQLQLNPNENKQWIIVGNVNQTHSGVAELIHNIQNKPGLYKEVLEDIKLGRRKLIALNATADGIQLTADSLRDSRHFSNVLFNNMRGGIFDNNYTIEHWDFALYIEQANKNIFKNNKNFLDQFPDQFSLQQLRKALEKIEDQDLVRLAIEYLPIKFSRRHGDPSRPWNRFSINMINETDGSKVLDYEGNWRDIFQNWEAMVHSFPDFIDGMIFRFLNASTFDGYNPYRITKGGFDWETIEPDDPWSYIGYWGDHQIIYLLKFLEFIENHYPNRLHEHFDKEIFVYANVPYKIKPYELIIKNPKDTIDFDEAADRRIRERIKKLGSDGSLILNEAGQIHHVNFIEKILATVLSKISNFIPDGGIWMNTQRPEWNDANNALVGNGISMVTLYYLRRFLQYFHDLLSKSNRKSLSLSNELMDFYKQVRRILEAHVDLESNGFDGIARKKLVDELGQAASDYRNHIYKQSFWGKKRSITLEGLKHFVNLSLEYIDQSIKSNLRPDGLYHAYNLLTIGSNELSIDRLSEMLEGQVAVLSSGYLKSEESLHLLDSMKNSALFRPDQYSYLLYPKKELPSFLTRNSIAPELAAKSKLIKALLSDGNIQIVEQDLFGIIHFNGNFRNANDLKSAIKLLDETKYGALANQETRLILDIFESVFNHKAFTGRSGTFYGYEGLGSIYWHMDSKLLLAVQETCLKAIKENADPSIVGKLLEHFYEINEGIGVHKSPELYGAFPTDPYSHTPAYKGAQQPGMTGQVKEDILSRFGELGVFVADGKLSFYPCLLRKSEFIESESKYNYVDLNGESKSIILKAGSLAFSYCQIPVIYHLHNENQLHLIHKDGTKQTHSSLSLSPEESKMVFERTAELSKIELFIDQSILK